MMRSLCVLTFGAFLSSSFIKTAYADGMPSLKDTPVRESYGWNGIYVAVGGGGAFSDHSRTIKKQERKEECKKFDKHGKCIKFEFGDWKDVKTIFDDSDNFDAFGTFQIGLDRVIHDRWVLGAFTDVDLGLGDNAFDHAWSVGGRLGHLISEPTLLYAVGGYTEASLDDNNSFGLRDDDDVQGWFVGAGGECALHKNVSLKLEYRFADYDAGGRSTTTIAHCGHKKHCRTIETEDELELHTIRSALVFRLDEHEPSPEPLK